MGKAFLGKNPHCPDRDSRSQTAIRSITCFAGNKVPNQPAMAAPPASLPLVAVLAAWLSPPFMDPNHRRVARIAPSEGEI